MIIINISVNKKKRNILVLDGCKICFFYHVVYRNFGLHASTFFVPRSDKPEEPRLITNMSYKTISNNVKVHKPKSAKRSKSIVSNHKHASAINDMLQALQSAS